MERMIPALVCALGLHGVFVFFTVPIQRPVAPRLVGHKSIQIQLADPGAGRLELETRGKNVVAVSRQVSPVDETVFPVLPVAPEVREPIKKTVKQAGPVQLTQKQPMLKVKAEVKKLRLQPEVKTPQQATRPPEEIIAVDVPVSTGKGIRKKIPGSTRRVVPARIKATLRYDQNPVPKYPPLARRRGQEGTVILSVTVSAAGVVQKVLLHATSGYALLDRSAVKTVKTWEFVPGSEHGRSVATEVLVPVHFVLE